MSSQKYSVNQYLLESVLNWVKSGEIAIPEIQRPFVWDASKKNWGQYTVFANIRNNCVLTPII